MLCYTAHMLPLFNDNLIMFCIRKGVCKLTFVVHGIVFTNKVHQCEVFYCQSSHNKLEAGLSHSFDLMHDSLQVFVCQLGW